MTNKYLYLVLLVFLIANRGYAQLGEACNLWKSHSGPVNNKIDTLKVKVRYLGTLENKYHHAYPASEKKFQFYETLEKQKGLQIALEFELTDSDCGFYFPVENKNKYKYKLFHRENKTGKFEDWSKGQLLSITLVRYHNYFPDTKKLITIVTDIEPL